MPDLEEPVIDKTTRLAARRGFIRTTAQAYAATLTTGIPSATAILALVQDQTGWLLAGITVGLAIVSPPAAGLASYLSIISNGLPAAYTASALAQIPQTGPTTKTEGYNG